MKGRGVGDNPTGMCKPQVYRIRESLGGVTSLKWWRKVRKQLPQRGPLPQKEMYLSSGSAAHSMDPTARVFRREHASCKNRPGDTLQKCEPTQKSSPLLMDRLLATAGQCRNKRATNKNAYFHVHQEGTKQRQWFMCVLGGKSLTFQLRRYQNHKVKTGTTDRKHKYAWYVAREQVNNNKKSTYL